MRKQLDLLQGALDMLILTKWDRRTAVDIGANVF